MACGSEKGGALDCVLKEDVFDSFSLKFVIRSGSNEQNISDYKTGVLNQG